MNFNNDYKYIVNELGRGRRGRTIGSFEVLFGTKD